MCLCSWATASALVPTLFIILVAIAMSNTMQARHKRSNNSRETQNCHGPLNIGEQVCLCSWTSASALVPTLFIILVAIAMSNTMQAGLRTMHSQGPSSGQSQNSHGPRHRTMHCAHPNSEETQNSHRPLNIGEQVCLCSWATASTLVPALFIILVAIAMSNTTQARHKTIQWKNKKYSRKTPWATQHWRASVSALMDSCLSSGANTVYHPCGHRNEQHHASRTQNDAQPRPELRAITEFVWAALSPKKHRTPIGNSTLESKCVCAHGLLPQLWCQHCFFILVAIAMMNTMQAGLRTMHSKSPNSGQSQNSYGPPYLRRNTELP